MLLVAHNSLFNQVPHDVAAGPLKGLVDHLIDGIRNDIGKVNKTLYVTSDVPRKPYIEGVGLPFITLSLLLIVCLILKHLNCWAQLLE